MKSPNIFQIIFAEDSQTPLPKGFARPCCTPSICQIHLNMCTKIGVYAGKLLYLRLIT